MTAKTTEVKVIVGANYGDEGKGLGTDYFCSLNPQSTIGVLTNGSAQRAHTVDTKDGLHHVFHNFSSGTFNNVPTYICDEFLINPMSFVEEYNELEELGYAPKYYIHPNCRVVTPFDMIQNQIDMKRDNAHNSCGMGVWRTINRYDKKVFNLTVKELFDLVNNPANAFKELYKVFLYYYKDIDTYCSGINIKGLINHFIEDLQFIANHCILLIEDNFLRYFETVVFENGQGLLLSNSTDPDNIWNISTSTDTGLTIPLKIIENTFYDIDVEVCYVTRTYLTRHGDGNLDGTDESYYYERTFFDYTNIYNPFQGKLRYADLNVRLLIAYISNFSPPTLFKSNNYSKSLLITHWNEAQFNREDMKRLKDYFGDNIYISDSKYRDSVKKYNEMEIK
jgi:adenylosuccinate synthase